MLRSTVKNREVYIDQRNPPPPSPSNKMVSVSPPIRMQCNLIDKAVLCQIHGCSPPLEFFHTFDNWMKKMMRQD